MSEPILRVEGITKQYKTKKGMLTALEPATFSIDKSELVSIVGPSGCGKSTLLHIIGGLIEPTAGQMFLDDVGTLFVVDKGSFLTGVLSRKDLLRTSLGSQNLSAIPVHIIMTRMPNITICTKNDSLIQAAHRLINQQIDALPVVDEQPGGFKVVGRLTKTNITRAFLSLSESHEL